MKKFNIIFLLSALLMFSCEVDNNNNLSDLFDNTPESVAGVSGDLGKVDIKKVGTTEPSVSQGTAEGFIEISWKAVEGVDGYVVYRKGAKAKKDSFGRIIAFESDSAAEYVEIARPDGKAVAYKDSSIDPFSAYYYCIKAFKKEGENFVEGLPSYAYSGWALSAPSEVTATFKISPNYIGVKWNHVPFAKKYNIYRSSEKDGTFNKIGTEILNFFEDNVKAADGPLSGVSYYYKVVAETDKGVSGFSPVSTGGGLIPPGAVPPPSEVTASRAESNTSVIVRWAASESATGYVLYKALNPEDEFVRIGDGTPLTEAQYEDTDVVAGQHYYYKVSCLNNSGDEGALSLNIDVDTAPDSDNCTYTNEGYIMTVPTGLSVNFKTGTIAIVSWKPVEGADAYIVRMKGGAEDVVISPENCAATLFEYDSFDAAAEVVYTVSAINNNPDDTTTESAESSEVSAVLLPAGFSASDNKYNKSGEDLNGYVELTWDDQYTALDGFTYTLLKKQPLDNDYAAVSGFDIGTGKFVDSSFHSYSYVDFDDMFPEIVKNESETPQEALKRHLSTKYKLEITKDGFETQSVECDGVQMFSATEFFYMLKVSDHVATNKITNQITDIYDAPNYLGKKIVIIVVTRWVPGSIETDMGYRSGSVVFTPERYPSSDSRNMRLSFTFDNYSDYHGIVVNGKYFVKKSEDQGWLNNESDETTNVTIYDGIQFFINTKIQIHVTTSAPQGGTVYFDVKQDGTTISHNEFVSPGIFSSFKDSVRCPGGRNFTRNGHESTGHYNFGPVIDSDKASINAKISEPNSIKPLID